MFHAAKQDKAAKVPGVRFHIIRNALKERASGGDPGLDDKDRTHPG